MDKVEKATRALGFRRIETIFGEKKGRTNVRF